MEQVQRLYGQIVKKTGGEYGYLGASNLDFILDAVKGVGEKLPKKQALVKKAAFLLHRTITAHPFVNGNKRTAYEFARLFLHLNGYGIHPSSPEAYQLLLRLAKGEASASEVEAWIATNLTERTQE